LVGFIGGTSAAWRKIGGAEQVHRHREQPDEHRRIFGIQVAIETNALPIPVSKLLTRYPSLDIPIAIMPIKQEMSQAVVLYSYLVLWVETKRTNFGSKL